VIHDGFVSIPIETWSTLSTGSPKLKRLIFASAVLIGVLTVGRIVGRCVFYEGSRTYFLRAVESISELFIKIKDVDDLKVNLLAKLLLEVGC